MNDRVQAGKVLYWGMSVWSIKQITDAQLALVWILRRPEISSVITGATKPEHVESTVAASDVELSDDVLAHIKDVLENKPTFDPMNA